MGTFTMLLDTSCVHVHCGSYLRVNAWVPVQCYLILAIVHVHFGRYLRVNGYLYKVVSLAC